MAEIERKNEITLFDVGHGLFIFTHNIITMLLKKGICIIIMLLMLCTLLVKIRTFYAFMIP